MDVCIRVTASQRQHTPAGDLLGRMYYSGFLDKALSRNDYSGYPHNGGEHTLHLHLRPADLDAFLALVQEHYPRHEGTQPFVTSVREKMHARQKTFQ